MRSYEKSQTLGAPSDAVAIGFDIGGTKINVLNDSTSDVMRLNTADYSSPADVVDDYLAKASVIPRSICLGIAAVRNPSSGRVKLVKRGWPEFDPAQASRHYGAQVETANDMITSAVGIFEQTNDVITLKNGISDQYGPKLVYSWSTGIGAAIVAPHENGNSYLPSACGHAGFAPQYPDEADYLTFISQRHKGKISLEFALGGDVGMSNMLDYESETKGISPEFKAFVIAQKRDGVPVAKTYIELAQAENVFQKDAKYLLAKLGGMMGYALRNQVLAVETRDVRFTGSVALSLLPHLVEHTNFIERFIDEDARCAYVLEDTALHVVNNDLVAVEGALIIAKNLPLQSKK